MTPSVLKQDPNTKKFKRTLIYFNTDMPTVFQAPNKLQKLNHGLWRYILNGCKQASESWTLSLIIKGWDSHHRGMEMGFHCPVSHDDLSLSLSIHMYIYQGQPTQKLCHENVTFHLLHAYLLCWCCFGHLCYQYIVPQNGHAKHIISNHKAKLSENSCILFTSSQMTINFILNSQTLGFLSKSVLLC